MKRGACPTLRRPMPSGDGWLARVHPPAGRLDGDQLRAVADAALRHGNGVIELTNRGNLQIRGLTEASAPRFAAEMEAYGLGDTAPVLVSPLAGLDPGCAPDTASLATAIGAMLAIRPGLPAKFSCVVDGGGALGLDSVRADVRVRAGPDGWVVAGGEAVGTSPNVIGALGFGLFGVGLAFGRGDAAQFRRLADLAERYANTLILTPWRAVMLAGVPAGTVRTEDFITDPADPRRAVTACIGRPGCAAAETDTADAAARIAALAIDAHVSGCAKGCAHPGPAPLTLVGDRGHWALVRDGRAADPPWRTNLTLADALAALSEAHAA